MRRDAVYASRQLAGRVLRYHTWPVLRQQSVGEHTWRLEGIYVELFGLPRPEVWWWMHNHDVGELWAGDVPFGAKQAVPGLKDAMNASEAMGMGRLGVMMPRLTEQEWSQVKLCDLLEMWEFGMVEMQMGNMLAGPIVDDTMNAALKLADELCTRDAVRRWSSGQWRRDSEPRIV